MRYVIVLTNIVYDDAEGDRGTVTYQTGLTFDPDVTALEDVQSYICKQKLEDFFENEPDLTDDNIVHVDVGIVGPNVLKGFIQHLARMN